MRHILLVDDEPEVLEGLLLILGEIPNATFHTAEYASQALRIMDSIPISLVLADIRMPGMNGIEMWEAISKRAPSCRVIFLSGVRDFDPIYRIIQSPNAKFLTKMEPAERILAVVEETLNELDQQDSRQTEAQFRELYTCLTSGETERQAAMERLCGMDGPVHLENGTAFACFFLCHAWALSTKEQNDSLACLTALIPRQANGTPTHFLRVNSSRAVLIVQSAPDSPEEAFREEMRRIASQAEKAAGVHLNCIFETGILSPQTLLSDCLEALESSKQMDMTYAAPLSLFQVQSGKTPNQKAAYRRIDFQLQLLQSFLLLGQKASFCQLAAQLFDEYMAPDQDMDCTLYIFFSILAMLMHGLMKTENAGLLKRLKEERYFAPKRPLEWQQARARLLDDCAEAFDTLFPPDPYAHPKIVASIQRYIQDHMDQNLSLNALSAKFNMTPNYLSRLFRENTGCKLHDYITELRLGTAERLLRTSNMHVNEVASAVGYDSVHTFIRAFRRQFGDTPADYRIKKSAAREP